MQKKLVKSLDSTMTTLFQGSELNHLDLEEPESRWEIKSQVKAGKITYIPSADEQKVFLLARPNTLYVE